MSCCGKKTSVDKFILKMLARQGHGILSFVQLKRESALVTPLCPGVEVLPNYVLFTVYLLNA